MSINNGWSSLASRKKMVLAVRFSVVPRWAVALSCYFCFFFAAAQHDSCNGVVANIGDGRCDAALNTLGCGWDGGDCCPCDCVGPPCGTTEYNCVNPKAGDELYDCQIPPPSPLPCSADAQRAWLVDSSAQAHALAAAVNCSGGSFEVEWKGHIAVDEAIYVVDGTVLIVTGGSSTAVVDGNGSTRLFTVVNATLHVSGVNITTGAGAAGGAIAASRASLTLNRTSLTGNRSAGKGGAVYLSGGSTMACSDVSFVSNSADVGGAVYVADHSVVSCGGSWLKNTAVRNGGALSVGEGSSVSWEEEATFARNTAGMFGGALIVSDRSSVFWSAPSSFFSNRAVTGGGGGGYVNFGSSVSWNATTRFDSNDGGGGGGGLGVDGESNVFWAGPTTYVNNSAEIGGALVVVNSTVSWTGEVHSLFDGNNARLGGALEIEYSSHLSCTENTKSSFTNNWATTAGGALFVDSMSSVFFGGDVWFHRNIASSELRELESGVGGAVFVDVGSSVAWHRDARFTENSADKIGGALYLSQSSISWSSSTHFAENHAGISGGALFLWNGSLVEWTGDTTFASNEAAADGGAVASPGFDPEFNLQSSRLLMNGPTTFVNNTSGANGGALSSLGALSVLIMGENVDFSGNSARDAGGAVYVSATGLGPVFAGMRFLSNSAQVGGAASIVASGNLKRVEDVESPNPTTFDRCIFIDNTATATGGAIESAAGQDLIMNSVFEGNRAGAGGALRLAGMASVDNCSFVDNVSDDGEGAAVSNIGSISKMTTISFRGNAFFCRPDMFLDFHSGDPYKAVCDGCQQASCDGCFFKELDLVPACQDVLEHSSSSGGTVTLETLLIEPGYWRANASSTDILPCYHADTCLGGMTGASDYCLEGYHGPYCSVCSDGHTAQLGYTCDKCSDSTGGVVFVAVVVLAILAAGVAVVAYVLSGEVGFTRRRGWVGRLLRNIPLQSVKVVVVAWQIVTQFTAVANVTFPHTYQRLLDALDVFNFDLTWILSAGCVVDADFHDRLLVSTITPLAALFFMAGTYTAATAIHQGAPEALQVIWNKHVSLVLLLTFLIYSSVTSSLFKTFACEPLKDGNVYLRADYSIQCDSPKHEAFEMYAGAMMVPYTAGIPALYGYLLFRDRDVLAKNEAEREDVPRVTTISDLWKPYKPSVFYYEIIECSRRVLLTGVVVFIEPNTSAQIAVTLMMAFVFEALAPYASMWDAWLSRMGHAVVFVSMYVALLLKVDVSDERAGSQRVFEVVLVSAHACMIFAVVVETAVLMCLLDVDAQQRVWVPPRFRRDSEFFPGNSLEEGNHFASHVDKSNEVALA